MGTARMGNIIQMLSTGAKATTVTSTTATRIDAATERVAASFVAGTTSPIAAVAVALNFSGNTSTVILRVGIQADSGNAPDGTYLGSADALFNGQNNTGIQWLARQTLMDAATHGTPTNTGNIVIGRKYWVVVDVSSDPAPAVLTGTPYIELRRDAAFAQCHIALYTGTWAVQTYGGIFVAQHADASFTGLPISMTNQPHGAALDIYVNTGVSQRQGLRFKVGAQCMVLGAEVILNKTGTPGNLTLRLYEGATEKAASPAIPVAEVVDDAWCPVLLTTPILCAADTNLYLVLEQDGTSDSHDYDVRGTTYPTAYVTAIEPGADWRFVYGTGSDPTAYTVDSSGFSPRIVPLIADMSTDFDQAATGGTSTTAAVMIR